jgi:hypothetical protein
MCYASKCRARAEACVNLAHSVKDAQLQSTLFEIAQSWTKLAVQLERGLEQVESRE